ncbi:recombinase family protein [Pseudomonas sp. 43(2021)]|uniref:recombinase family protein n=1 Tax=Pseudomonas sp. 43(2021) TaxID=2813560 RepID=UPI001A9DD23C|nr:recombinase family protein [Pseudomonas sp. 43(2021)]
MPKAYAYVRYSSTIQETGDSVDRQVSPLESFAKESGIPVVEVLIDEGVSSFRGDNAKKGKLKSLLDRIESGEIEAGDYVVVESIDRITRQRLINGVDLLQSILRRGVRIFTTADRQTYSYDDPAEDFRTLMKIGLIAERANNESAEKSRRRRSAWKKAKREAVSGSKKFNAARPPYGIRYDKDAEAFVVVEEEAAEIRKIFELLKVMGVSNAIKEVNKDSKRKWTPKAVSLMIQSKYPIGVLMSQRRGENYDRIFEEYIDGYYPNIVSYTEYQSALAAIASRKRKTEYGKSTVGHVNIFRHVVKCRKCGASLFFERQRGSKNELYAYLHCSTKKELKGGCEQRMRFDLAFGMLLSLAKLLTEAENKPVGFRRIRDDANVNAWLRKKYSNLKSVTSEITVIKREVHVSEKDQHVLTEIRKLRNGFSKFLTASPLSESRLRKSLREETEKLAKLKTTYANYDESLSQYDGAIPKVLIRKLADLELDIATQVQVVDELGAQVDSANIDVKIADVNDLIEKFSTEPGRLELNSFFKSQAINFYFEFDPDSRIVTMDVKQGGTLLTNLARPFALHRPLRDFGISRLADLYE